jgi:hypothetical protein
MHGNLSCQSVGVQPGRRNKKGGPEAAFFKNNMAEDQPAFDA